MEQPRTFLKEIEYADAVNTVIEEVDKGRLRVAEPSPNGWQTNEWIKQSILLYFSLQQMRTWNLSPLEFYDKMPLKKQLCTTGRARSAACNCPLWGLHSPQCSAYAQLCKHWCTHR